MIIDDRNIHTDSEYIVGRIAHIYDYIMEKYDDSPPNDIKYCIDKFYEVVKDYSKEKMGIID